MFELRLIMCILLVFEDGFYSFLYFFHGLAYLWDVYVMHAIAFTYIMQKG